jgi:hypothetical protein
MNQDLKKYLKVGGILCAIGAVSAILITCTNLLTAPKIAANEAEKKAAGFRSVYENTASVGDDVAVSGHYVSLSNVCYSDTAKTTEIGTVYTATGSYKHVSGMKILVGVSGDKNSPVLGKIYLLKNGATGGYDATVKNNYVDKYNANPSPVTMDAISCGATEAATVIRNMMKEAKDIYSSGGVVEDIATEIKSIFANASTYGDENSGATEIVNGVYAKSYYPVYSDAERKTYIGSVYRLSGLIDDGTGASLTIMIGMSGDFAAPTYGKIQIAANEGPASISDFVSAYNAAPSETALDATAPTGATAAAALVKKMALEASSNYVKGIGNLTSDGAYLRACGGAAAFADAVTVNTTTSEKKTVTLAGGSTGLANYTYTVDSYRISYSDAAKSTVKSYVYKATGSVTFEAVSGDYDAGEHTAKISLLVSLTGDATNVTSGQRVILSDDSFETAGMGNADINTGATYSGVLCKELINQAVASYKTVKGGN